MLDNANDFLEPTNSVFVLRAAIAIVLLWPVYDALTRIAYELDPTEMIVRSVRPEAVSSMLEGCDHIRVHAIGILVDVERFISAIDGGGAKIIHQGLMNMILEVRIAHIASHIAKILVGLARWIIGEKRGVGPNANIN